MKRALHLLLVLFSIGIQPAMSQSPQPGVILVNDSVRNDREYYTLNGDWEFYWNVLYTPKDFLNESMTVQPNYVRVPGTWTMYDRPNGESYPEYGYATFRVRVKMKHPGDNLALYVPKIWSASKVWVNGQLVSERGTVGTSREEFQNLIVQEIVPLARSEEYDIIVQVSNYSLFVAGIPEAFYIGKQARMQETADFMNTRNLIWLGFILVMAFYHFILWFYRRKNRSTLYFGIICVLIFIKATVFGNHYLYEYLKLSGVMNFNTQATSYYVTTYLLVAVGLYYIRSLYPDETSGKVVKYLMIITGAYCLFLIVTPPYIFSPTIMAFQVINFLGIAYVAYVLVRATIRKRPEAYLQTIGITLMVFAGINDALFSAGIEITGIPELIPFAFGGFLCLQFFVIAKRFSKAFTSVEELSQNLERKVVERTAEVVEQKAEIEKKNEDIEASIQYAKRIQTAMLPSESRIKEIIPESFVFFRPRDIVSGDFYFVDEVVTEELDIAIIAAVDCTGHGVPGAFMSMIGDSILRQIVQDKCIHHPDEMLMELNNGVNLALNQFETENRDGMDIALCVIDRKTSQLHFSGAGNPLILVRDGKLEQIKGDRSFIGGTQTNKKKFTKHTVGLDGVTQFYIFSDGFQDQFGGEQGLKFMKKRFREFLGELSKLPIGQQEREVAKTFDQWKGDAYDQIDDVLVMGFILGA